MPRRCLGVLSNTLPWLLLASFSGAADWPQWGGTDCRNMVSAEIGMPAWFVPGSKRTDGSGVDLATTQNVKWAAKVGSVILGNPTVAGGRILLGSNDSLINDPKYHSTEGGMVQCLDERTGRRLWKLVIPRLETDDPLFNVNNMNLGVCSSPTVNGDRIYLVTNRCEVLCLDANGMADGNDGPFRDEGRWTVGPGKPPVVPDVTDGDILWCFDMIKELPCWPQDAASGSPLVHGDFVYVPTSNGVDKSNEHVPYPDCPSLIALDKRTGRLAAYEHEGISGGVFHGQWSSPLLGVAGGKTLVFYGGGNGVCYAFEALPDGGETISGPAGDRPGVSKKAVPRPLKAVWRFDCNPPEYRFRNGKRIPYRDGDARRKAGNKNDGAYVGPSEIIATPVFYKNRVYVAVGQDPLHGRGKGMLTCIDATRTGDISKTGRIWSYDKLDRTLSTVSIADGLLYVCDFVGTLHCLDAETGRCYWTHATKAETWGSTLVADGKVYFGTQKAFWVLAAGKEKKLLGEFHLGAPVWCTPVTANGVLYVASQTYLWALQAGAGHPLQPPVYPERRGRSRLFRGG